MPDIVTGGAVGGGVGVIGMVVVDIVVDVVDVVVAGVEVLVIVGDVKVIVGVFGGPVGRRWWRGPGRLARCEVTWRCFAAVC